MSTPEIWTDEESPDSKRRKLDLNDKGIAGQSGRTAIGTSSVSISSQDLPEGFKTVSSILKDDSSESGNSDIENCISQCSVPDSILAGLSTPAVQEDTGGAVSIYDRIEEEASEQVVDKSRPASPEFAKPLPFFPNDHFDDISDSQLRKLENDAVKSSLMRATSAQSTPGGRWSQCPPSTMWVRKSLALKHSLISAIKEVEGMTRHIRELTKQLQEKQSVTMN